MPKGGNKPQFSGSPDNFQDEPFGTFTYSSFPNGWSDVALADPESTAPEPSAVVIKTTDAFGHSTRAVAILPGISEGQGIYRPIESANFYAMRADVRVDQFSETDPAAQLPDPNNPGFLVCGCPIGAENILDWPIQVTFALLDGVTPPTHAPTVGLVASAQTETWHLFGATANVFTAIDTGVHIELGKWYSVETDFDPATAALHGEVIDAATGVTLLDQMIFLDDPDYSFLGGVYNPEEDGVFNAEAFIEGEVSLAHTLDPELDLPNLAVIDNIDVWNQHSKGNAFAYGQGNGNNPKDAFFAGNGLEASS